MEPLCSFVVKLIPNRPINQLPYLPIPQLPQRTQSFAQSLHSIFFVKLCGIIKSPEKLLVDWLLDTERGRSGLTGNWLAVSPSSSKRILGDAITQRQTKKQKECST